MPGVTRSMPPSSSSSSLAVSDALSNLTKAATAALSAVQGAQEQVHSDLVRARAERDSALKALHDVQLDAKDLEAREEGYKAALDKSDLTIKHQAETIAQLRTEVQQWRTQLMRLEESSRQEIEGWKEQYRRAEHERGRLSTRIDDLVAGQIAWNAAAHAYTAPYTPRLGYSNPGEPSTSKLASISHSHRAGGTPHANGHNVDEDDIPPATSRKSKAPRSSKGTTLVESRSRASSPVRIATIRRKEAGAVSEVPHVSRNRATPRTPVAARSAPAQTGSQPRQQFIRRVTAVVDVKEEEDTDGGLDDLESAASGSVYDPDDELPIPPASRKRRASNMSMKPRRPAREYGDNEQSMYEDEGEGVGSGEEAEDDELLLGPKTQPRKPPRAQSGATKQAQAQARPRASAKQQGSAKKRKIIDGGVVSARPGPTKSAKVR